MKFLCTLFSLIILFSAYADVKFDSIRSETRGDLLFVIHEVEEEETLYSIARRYKSSVPSIIEHNNISDNRIDVGQVLSVLYNNIEETENETVSETPEGFHLVKQGETLYSISKIYDLRIREIRKLNKLQSNDISPGEYLRVKEPEEPQKVVEEKVEERETPEESGNESEIPEDFEIYIVQTAETLNSIARKRGIHVSELKEWNNLESDYIRIGQSLLVRTLVDSLETPNDSTSLSTRLDEDGFEKVYEEGIAGVISDISTSKYLALHRSMPIGTELEVRNLMNNFIVHVKVVGKLPNTGINRNILLRLSKPAFDQLGILDPKSRVEVSHFKK